MIIKQLRLLSSARHATLVEATRDNEPSHIHIARPSRVRRDTIGSHSSVEQSSGELRELDPAAAQVPLQAA